MLLQKSIIKTLSAALPGFFVNLAYNKLTSPQIKKLREREIAVLDTAEQANFEFKDFKIRTYHWAGKGERILLIHGWEGQAGNFADLILSLKNEDYDIYAFDGPSHGYSSRGSTSLFEFTELVGVLIKRWATKKLVSHSFGGVATTYALYTNPDIKIEAYALLTTPDRFLDRIYDVQKMTGLHDRVISRLIEKIEQENEVEVPKLNVSDYVKQIKVDRSLIIHDVDDKVIPIKQSMRVHANWENCTIVEVSGTGHFRILRDDRCIEQVLDFLKS